VGKRALIALLGCALVDLALAGLNYLPLVRLEIHSERHATIELLCDGRTEYRDFGTSLVTRRLRGGTACLVSVASWQCEPVRKIVRMKMLPGTTHVSVKCVPEPPTHQDHFPWIE
jgi:hypothetical protein